MYTIKNKEKPMKIIKQNSENIFHEKVLTKDWVRTPKLG